MRACFGGGKGLAVSFLLALLAAGCTKKEQPAGPQSQDQPPTPSRPGPPRPDIVMGSVQFEDAPVMAGRVELYDDQGQVIARAPIGSDGTFQIPKVAPGTYKVAVKTSQVPVDESVKLPMDGGGQPSNGPPNGPPTPPMPPRGPGGRGHAPPGMGAVKPPTPSLTALTKELKAKYERIDPKYEDPAKSGLTCPVTKGLTTLEPWKLQAAAAAPMKTPEKTP